MVTDLFGNPIQAPKKLTWEEEYDAYIHSPKWRKLCNRKLEAVGNKCEDCGISTHSAKLEVHHLHYDTFKQERLKDLKVLCPECHKKADKVRERRVEQEREDRQEEAQVEGYARKVHGEDWSANYLYDEMRQEFLDWLDKKAMRDLENDGREIPYFIRKEQEFENWIAEEEIEDSSGDWYEL